MLGQSACLLRIADDELEKGKAQDQPSGLSPMALATLECICCTRLHEFRVSAACRQAIANGGDEETRAPSDLLTALEDDSIACQVITSSQMRLLDGTALRAECGTDPQIVMR